MSLLPLAVLEVTNLPGKGRGYKAITDIPAGAIVHVSEPLATVVSQEWAPETCMWCFGFSYPKKQKVKALNDQELSELMSLWELKSSKKGKGEGRSVLPSFKDMLFCSENCKQTCVSQGYQPEEWCKALALNYRMEVQMKKSQPPDKMSTAVSKEFTHVFKDCHSKWVDLEDDEALTTWLNHTWDILTTDLDLFKEIDSSDKAMCRLIGACISRKIGEEAEITQSTNSNVPKFRDLLTIQNNELSHFRSHFSNHVHLNHLKKLPFCSRKEEYLSILPTEVIEVMALYSFFARACVETIPGVPTLSQVDHSLFRSIYFRERSNSFGLWEMGDIEIAKVDGGVTDDLELLGWGIYPSAVYFNHSCDANVYKVRDGRKIKFIARRMIERGEEACISYGSVGESLEDRRARLFENYHFFCNCTRCIDEDLRNRTVSR